MSESRRFSKTSTEKSGKTVNDAILEALSELGATKDEVTVDILDEGKSGFFGIGRKDATVRVTIKQSVIDGEQKPVKEEAKPSVTVLKGEKRNPKPKMKKAEKPAEEKKAAKEIKPVKQNKLPPERRSAPKPKAEPKPKEEAPAAVEMTPEKKAEAAKVFATPEVRHPKKSERKERPERRPRHERTPKPEAADNAEPAAEPRPRTPKKISGIPPKEIAEKFLTDIFSAMQLDVKVEAQPDGEGAVLVNLSGENMGIIIGKRGDTLDSLQYLTSLVINQQTEGYTKVTIDTENYREKRSEALIALSSRLAEKVSKSGKKFTLEPMNPYERRIIHSNLQEHELVTTFSIGVEPYRKVVIAPKDRKPFGKKPAFKKRPPRKRRPSAPKTVDESKPAQPSATYKADFKPQQHKAEFKSFEDYFNAQESE